MKAYVLHGVNDLRYENVPSPACPQDWAVIKVKAAGICSSDIPRIYKKGAYRFPLIPGHEVSGVVERVGDPENDCWIGRRVSVFPLIPCRQCGQCAAHRYEMCEHYDYIGSRRDGGFAEEVAVPVWNLLELPDSVSFDAGAALEPLAVALHAVKQIGDLTGSSVTVIGTGVIGMAAACWAKLRGAAQVHIVGRSGAKRPIAERAGGLTYHIGTAPKGDAVIEAVGTPEAVAAALCAAGPGACVVLTGNPAGDMTLTQNVYWTILRRQLRVSGTWNSFYDGKNASDWTETLEALKCGKLDAESLITHRFPQEKLEDGLRLMADHRKAYCKVMTVWNG